MRPTRADFSYLDSEAICISLDHSMPPINGLRVRKALNMAIDREAFIGTLLPEGTLQATALFPPPFLGWSEEVQSRKYAPEGARQLLEEAGADGVPVDTKMTLVARPGNFPNLTEVMEAIQQQLHEGVSASICNSMRSPSSRNCIPSPIRPIAVR